METNKDKYSVTKNVDGSYTVTINGIIQNNAKGAMRQIADAIGFQYDSEWTTHQFGAKLMKALAEQASSEFDDTKQAVMQSAEIHDDKFNEDEEPDDEFSEDEESDDEFCENIEYKGIGYSVSGSTACVDMFDDDDLCDKDSLVIPEIVIDSETGKKYFPDDFRISDGSYTSLTLPPTIVRVDGEAFSEHENVKQLKINWSNNPSIFEADGIIFARNTHGEKSVSLENVQRNKPMGMYRVPDGVTYIGVGAFHQCDNLKVIEFPASVKSVDFDAFSECDNLERLIFHTPISSIISYNDFGEEVSLSENVPEGVKVDYVPVEEKCTGDAAEKMDNLSGAATRKVSVKAIVWMVVILLTLFTIPFVSIVLMVVCCFLNREQIKKFISSMKDKKKK